MPSFSRALFALLSPIESPNLTNIGIHVNILDMSLHDVSPDTRAVGTSESVADLHATLSRDVFARLRAGSVRVQFSVSQIPAAMQSRVSAEIAAFLVPLFVPWLARRVVILQLPEGTSITELPHDVKSVVCPLSRLSVADMFDLDLKTSCSPLEGSYRLIAGLSSARRSDQIRSFVPRTSRYLQR